MQKYYLSVPRLLVPVFFSFLSSVFSLGGAVLISLGSHSGGAYMFLTILLWCAAFLSVWMLVMLCRTLRRVRLPVLQLGEREIILFHPPNEVHIPYANVRRVEMINSSPEWPGKAIIVEMEGAYEDNQLRYRTHQIDLSTTTASPTRVFNQIRRRVQQHKAAPEEVEIGSL